MTTHIYAENILQIQEHVDPGSYKSNTSNENLTSTASSEGGIMKMIRELKYTNAFITWNEEDGLYFRGI